MPIPIHIVIADDHNLFIEGLLLLLQGEPDIEIAAVANNVQQLLQLLPKTLPDVILLDINMPGISGIDALKPIRHNAPKTKVIMLSTYNEEHLIEKSRVNGADGYLLKNTNKEDLLQSIREIYNGGLCFPTKSNNHQSPFPEDGKFLSQFSLTKRENELLQLIKKSYTNHQIADYLNLSIYTVETHRKNIMQKLKLKSPLDLIKFIMQHNL